MNKEKRESKKWNAYSLLRLNKWTLNSSTSTSIINLIQLLVIVSKKVTMLLSLTLSGLVTIQLMDYKHDILADNFALNITPYSYAVMTYFITSLIFFVGIYIIKQCILERHGLLTIKSWNKWINR